MTAKPLLKSSSTRCPSPSNGTTPRITRAAFALVSNPHQRAARARNREEHRHGGGHQPDEGSCACASFSAQARRPHAFAALLAKAGAFALGRDGGAVCLRLYSVHDLCLVHRQPDFALCGCPGAAELRSDRSVELSKAVQPVPLGNRDHKSRGLRLALYPHLLRDRADAGDFPRPENPRRRCPAPDLSLSDGAEFHCDRHRLEVVS